MKRWIWAMLLAGCAMEAEPPPDAPDISRLVSDWSGQTGELSGESGQALLQGFVDDYETIEQMVTLLSETLLADDGLADDEGTEASGQGLGVQRRALSVEAGGWARITYICPGAAPEVVDEAQGKLELLAAFGEDGIRDDQIWGEALACALGTSLFDGDLNLWLSDGTAAVLDFEGELSGVKLPFEIGLVNDTFQLRRIADEGSFLVGFDPESTEDLSFEITDANRTWDCTLAQNLTSGRCEDEGEVVSW